MSEEYKDLSYQKKIRSRDELVKQMNQFKLDIKPSVGIWCFSPGGGRFHERYVKELSVEERLKLAEDMAQYGLKGIEAHYPTEVNWDNLDLYKKLEKNTGIKLVLAGFAHFYEKDFEFGALSNPDPKVRDKAIRIAVEGFKLTKEMDAFAVSWPGIDGYTYPLGTVFYWMWNFFEEAVALALDEVPGARLAIEPKPYEPAPNNIYRTTAEGILAAQRIEKKLKNPANRKLLDKGTTIVGLNPEVGHVRMGYEDLAAAYSLVAFEGRLMHTHWNSQPLGNYDQDLNIGVVEWQQAEALLYALKMIGYQGYYGIDINPERMPIQKAVEINIKALDIMNERIERLPHERLIECYLHPAKHRGEIESILLDNMTR